MKYVAAYLLAQLGGNATPSAADVTKILTSVGVDVDAARLDTLVKELEGKNVTDLIAAGRSKLSSVPSGGAAAPAAAGAAAPAAAAAGKKEEAKPAAKEEKKEDSEDDDMGFGLFD